VIVLILTKWVASTETNNFTTGRRSRWHANRPQPIIAGPFPSKTLRTSFSPGCGRDPMSTFDLSAPIDLRDPVLVIAVGGWVNAGSVATTAGELLCRAGETVARFDPDALYDYGTHRPTVEFSGGFSTRVVWPGLSVTAVGDESQDLLVVSGDEPDRAWQLIATELTQLASSSQVAKVVAIGSISAAVSHTRDTPIMITSTDPTLEPVGIPTGTFSVPASFVNAAMHQISTVNEIPAVGFWAQVPHYVSGVYWPAAEAVLNRLSLFLGTEVDASDLHARARDLIELLDAAVADRPDARELIRSLEQGTPDFGPEEASNIAEEIESFLKEIEGDENPFR
jgi:proteasome assembly chaperone (PAC2) family protein